MGYRTPGARASYDDFRGKQLPDVDPADDLSRFVAERIREAETEPVVDQVPAAHDDQPMAYRYAQNMRRDMVTYRRIVEAYVACVNGHAPEHLLPGLHVAVLFIANQWTRHDDFRPEWLIA